MNVPALSTIANLLEKRKEGWYCPAGDFYLDATRAVHRVIVSHAHSDHAAPHSREVYCTATTRDLLLRRLPSNRSAFQVTEFGQAVEFGPVRVTLFPAGHMLGSAQVLMEWEGVRYLYTGDFKLQPDLTCEAFVTVPCDHLITETTFARPEYDHPHPEEALSQLPPLSDATVIGAYSLGKAQRVTRLIHDYFPERKVFVHPEIVRFHHVYEEHGIVLGDWQPYQRTGFRREAGSVLILPPSVFSRFDRMPGVRRLFATGWKRAYMRCDGVLPVSDHADWKDLLRLIKACGAHTVHTLHGDGSTLQQFLEGSGKTVMIAERIAPSIT
jgi:putative mRNA 3-end processing factor